MSGAGVGAGLGQGCGNSGLGVRGAAEALEVLASALLLLIPYPLVPYGVCAGT